MYHTATYWILTKKREATEVSCKTKNTHTQNDSTMNPGTRKSL
jgi:hypothetical protein